MLLIFCLWIVLVVWWLFRFWILCLRIILRRCLVCRRIRMGIGGGLWVIWCWVGWWEWCCCFLCICWIMFECVWLMMLSWWRKVEVIVSLMGCLMCIRRWLLWMVLWGCIEVLLFCVWVLWCIVVFILVCMIFWSWFFWLGILRYVDCCNDCRFLFRFNWICFVLVFCIDNYIFC